MKEELERQIDKTLAEMYEISDHGKEFLSPNIRQQIIKAIVPIVSEQSIGEYKKELVEQMGAKKNPHQPDPIREFDHETTMMLRDGFEEARQAMIKIV